MEIFSQYREEYFLLNYFNNKQNGVLVDVGAADGIINSNSRFLIKNNNWSGILIEPHPEYFTQLNNLYKNSKNIKLYNNGVFNKNCVLPFYQFGNADIGQISTFSESFKEKQINSYGDKYKTAINIECLTLQKIFFENNLLDIDFMSIDCEGVDMEVLDSNDWNVCKPTLISVEKSMDESILNNFIKKIKYTKIFENNGNAFFEIKK